MQPNKLVTSCTYPSINWQQNLYGYFGNCYPFREIAKRRIWEHNKSFRKLGHLQKHGNLSACTILMSSLPAKRGEWVSLNALCVTPRQLNVGMREIYRRENYKKISKCYKKKSKRGKPNIIDSRNLLQMSEEQLFSRDFCDMLKDSRYCRAMAIFEMSSTHLATMWHPSGADKEIMSFAISKHATLNFLMATHSILPAELCFHSWELKNLTNLSYKWIGDMPPASTLDDISKFISDFNILFLSRSTPSMDPNTKRATQDQNKMLMEVLNRLDPQYSSKVANFLREEAKSFDFDPDERRLPECVPLIWEDQLSTKNERFRMAPEGHAFDYNERLSVAGRNCAVAIKGRLQHGYCYSDKFPRAEISVRPEFITNVHSVKARGPHHALTRSKIRTLSYVKCIDYRKSKESVYNPLVPAKEDFYYKDLCKDLPLHTNSPLALSARARTEAFKEKPNFMSTWLHRDVTVPSLTRPCSPDRFDVNRRAYLVNPQLPLAALGFTHCRPPPPRKPPGRVYHFNSDASAPTGHQPQLDRIRLPPIHRQVSAAKHVSVSDSVL